MLLCYISHGGLLPASLQPPGVPCCSARGMTLPGRKGIRWTHAYPILKEGANFLPLQCKTMPYRTLWYGPGQQEYGPNTVRCNTGKRHVCLSCSQTKCLKYHPADNTKVSKRSWPFPIFESLSLPLTGEGLQTASIHVIHSGLWTCNTLGSYF